MPPSMVLDRIRIGLQKTREQFHRALRVIELSISKDFESMSAELEELLLSADVGAIATQEIIQQFKERKADYSPDNGGEQLLATILREILEQSQGDKPSYTPPATILTVGVNGTGKTTSIAKLAKLYRDSGERVLLVASDTYRPAGIEQLCIWADRIGVEVLRSQLGQDPASVAYDAISSAFSKGFSVVIIDTAGRLHTDTNLIHELKKIRSVLKKKRSDLPQETFLVLDATTGQNGLNQARVFKDKLDVSGVILTKIDGTAKGGIIFAISMELGIPVRYVGVGEGIDDLLPFDASAFISSIL